MVYAVRLTVRLPQRRRVEHDEASYEFEHLGRSVLVHGLAGGKTVSDCDWLALTAVGFESQDVASDFGSRLKGDLRLAAVRANFGIDVGDERAIARPGQPVIDAAKEGGVQLLPTIHGIQVYEQTGADSHIFSRAELQVQTKADALFASWYETQQERRSAADSTALALACDLFSSADFETSRRARFIALITAVETLAADRYRIDPPLRAVVDGFLDALHGPPVGVEAADFESFRSRVTQLKQASITKSARQLVEQYRPDDGNPVFIVECYNARSRLVHGSLDVPDLQPLHDRLRALVREPIEAVADDVTHHGVSADGDGARYRQLGTSGERHP